MFDEPEESPSEQARTPADRAKEKGDEFRTHAELCAVFEANRKFNAAIDPKLDAQVARDAQKTVGRLEKARVNDTPLIAPESGDDALGLLNLPAAKGLSTNDYHIHRRPGEVMILRWIEGEQVESFYIRLQAHFDAAIKQYREEERQSQGWKQDPQTLAYLEALDALEMKMADRYLRDILRQHNFFALSTQSADEMDILHLCDFIMGLPSAEIVGAASAPPDQPTEQDRAWFFKLFSLRGMLEGRETMCFFTYLQKAEDSSF